MDTQPGSGLLIIERILRDRDGIWRQIIDERDLGRLTGQMLSSSAVSLALYGAVLGANYGWAQALSSAVKLPLLFLATLAICLPTLYLFNLVFGARLSVLQAVTLIMVCITVSAVLSLAFAPISLFFLVTAKSYAFFKLLNVGILMLTSLVGLRFLTAGMRALNAHNEAIAKHNARLAAVAAAETREPEPVLATVGAAEPGNGATSAVTPLTATTAAGASVITDRPPLPVRPRPNPHYPAQQKSQASLTLLYIWILLFGFVGTQLGWTLRPFFGSPGRNFELFRTLDGTFYGDIFTTIGHLLGG
jgi:hypothetical protein